ncbi:uncharacterized protein LOC121238988 isoform X4 [Juglans microcarpa x Juglans regia]|uniref:uncharacterized protein LOC121238988 isoform X4 n=1 Tax=Juglans microcarpa x Juglans regia TaxID=2249226 RepID=UPI001B7F0163|nr:uncharacterized protein LOC121238988 isoform X4 [Juglans microcarpa x Juglans regia]
MFRERERERVMVSRKHKRAAMYKKLQLLRSITNSHASKTSIILDASKYIEDLKRKIDEMNRDIVVETVQASLPLLKVEAQEKGFVIEVFTERSCCGLLVFILEAFEELGLDVRQARVSCSDRFHLEAIGAKDNQGDQEDQIDAQVVKEAVLQAIQCWSATSEQK